MRTLLIAGLLAFSTAALSQAQQQAPDQQSHAQQQKEDKVLLERSRVDGAAGGTAPVPEDKRKAVNANAGPHRHKTTPSPTTLPRDRPVEPPR